MPLDPQLTSAAVYPNASLLGRACTLAYESPAAGIPRFASELQMTATFISRDNTQVYVAHDAQNVVVAFRGSQGPTSIDGFKDWLLTNANNFLIVPDGAIGTDFLAAGVGARFHRGFIGALAEIWSPLVAQLEQLPLGSRKLWVTGHSLGGAIAMLASWRFIQNFLDVHAVYTFGSPMVGNEAASKAFERELGGRIFRFVDAPDLVPWLPTISLIANPFMHGPTEMKLASGAGAISSAMDLLRELAGVAVGGLLDGSLQDKIWAQCQQRLSAHDIANYCRLIDKGPK